MKETLIFFEIVPLVFNKIYSSESFIVQSTSFTINFLHVPKILLVRGNVFFFKEKYHHHHHVVPPARIFLALSRHLSLSFIASGRSSVLHPVSSHSCCMYVRAGRPAFARLYVGVHRSTSLMSSSLLLRQCPACLIRLTWIVFVMGGRWPYSWCLVGVASRTCSILLAAFLGNCRRASSPAVLLASK